MKAPTFLIDSRVRAHKTSTSDPSKKLFQDMSCVDEFHRKSLCFVGCASLRSTGVGILMRIGVQ